MCPGADRRKTCPGQDLASCLPVDRMGHDWPGLPGPTSDPPEALAGFTEDSGPSKSGASGAVNRSPCPDSVRYMSVTSVARRRLLTDDDRG